MEGKFASLGRLKVEGNLRHQELKGNLGIQSMLELKLIKLLDKRAVEDKYNL